ncbi:hypothetical protein HD599_002962 [Conyzicola lurida]|uniref:Uncharacterized protein n=1 Tax=Conyzicola lurida TaxID=1172621 RepID=A0A841ATB4_9MICO|nr:hypothetical protein [Conyzicola lurida]MBB5844639.1 hypothetical protein [Conyzicola lurida]
MAAPHRSHRALRLLARPLFRVRDLFAVAAAVVVLTLCAGPVLAFPPAPPVAARVQAFVAENAQSVTVPADAAAPTVARDSFSSTPGYASLAAGGTNYDWAKLVLLYADLPLTDENVTVFVRWMRQENGTDDWWNRNNPLNNGWGSGGAGGTGTYDNLDLAAQNAAEAFYEIPGYAGFVAAFAASSPTAVTESAIWASPWATGHYANGAHWSQAVVPTVKSPDGTW